MPGQDTGSAGCWNRGPFRVGVFRGRIANQRPQRFELRREGRCNPRHLQQQPHRQADDQIDQTEQVITSIHQAARQRIESSPAAMPESHLPEPVAKWDFEESLIDSIGGQEGTAHGNVRFDSGMLVLETGAYLTTAPLTETLTEKTLEAWVRLDNLDQRGGGVISLQSLDGSVFDAIVFGETEPRRWLAGSEHHRRTKSFGGPDEQQASERTVHLAIAYHADGTIVGYRDGVPYGNPYRSDPPIRFQRGQAVVSFGLRHLPAGGNRLLRGRIEQAALYNRALSETEIAASFQHASGGITPGQLLAAMNQDERDQLDAATKRLSGLQSDLQSLGPPREPRELAVWAEMSRALLLLKELIYVP